jgi:hypothetical protein
MILKPVNTRIKKLMEKFSGMTPGDQILVGISHPNFIKSALHGIRSEALIMNTGDRATRDDGVSVPVYLVTFT